MGEELSFCGSRSSEIDVRANFSLDFRSFLTSSASQTPAAVMANFGDLKSDGGLNKLNGFLSSKSYIEGFVYSSADDKTFGQLAKCPDAKKHPHAARWYRHIQVTGGHQEELQSHQRLQRRCPHAHGLRRRGAGRHEV